MNKLASFIVTAVIVLSPSAALAVATQSQGNGSSNSSSSSGQSSSNSTSNQEQTQTQTATQNSGEDTQISQEVQTKVKENELKYTPKNAAANQVKESTSTALAKLIELSARIDNKGITNAIENVAKNHSTATDEITQSIDKLEAKNSVLKFIFGVNYKEVKNAKAQIEQNRLRIQELNQIKAQITNESEATELQNQINVLETQNTSLEAQINEAASGFSLFGWLSKWISG